ncbi:SMC family ATPase [Arcicella sp. LKC2W]|uniref:SMC family ATPase n=1 Tax=Arcicella sp. LKC2W TaxID=2984198 RepID=UPI002B1F6A5F|nr:SMC family ATPase [Arcicella sp. LKC2W]MEA5459540.1 SMC family ATPase [Arcicella sp. LKC2W]
MIPKYLKIKGLYSYKTEQEIHFDQLTEAALFGIFGSVGSGKSSILEAITFALYGDTERLNNKGDDRTYNMMNLRSDDLSIDFECLAGKDAQHYRFSVRGKRNSKNFKDVKTFERKAYLKLNDEWSPITSEDVAEKVIGLSYENFRRTIIIPQGRFQEFIELRDNDRTKMMKELFNLDKYDLSRKVGSLNTKNKLTLSNLEGQLVSLGDATPDMVAHEEFHLKLARQEIKVLSEQLEVENEFDKALTELRQATEKIQILNSQVIDLEDKKDFFTQKEETLKIYEICSRQFKSLLELKKSNKVVFERNQEVFQKNEKQLIAIEKLLIDDKLKLELLRPQYDQKESLLTEAKELEIIIEILENQTQLSKKSGAIERGLEKQKTKETALALLKTQKQNSILENDKLKSELPNIQEFSSIKTWFNEADSLQEIKKKTHEEAGNLQKELVKQQDLRTEKISAINQHFSLEILTDCTTEIVENAFTDLLKNAEKEQQILTEKLENLNTQAVLQQYATDLKDGEECPLCGAIHHPALSQNGHDFKQEIQAIKAQISDFQKLPSRVRAAQMPVEKIFSEISNLEKNKTVIRNKWDEIKAKIENHEQLFIWEKFDKSDRESFEKTFNSITILQKQITDNEILIKNLDAKFEQESQAKIKDIDTPLLNLQNEISGLKITIETLSKQLRKVQFQDYENLSKEDVLSKIKSLKNQYETLKSDFETTQKKVAEFEQEKNVIAGSQQALSEVLKEAQSELKNTQEQIENLLVINNFDSENKISDILQEALNIDAERLEIENYKATLKNLTEQLRTYQKDYANLTYDFEKHKAVTDKIVDINTKLNAQRQEEGRIGGLLKKAQEDLAKKTELLKEQEKLKIREQHLSDLATLFRGNGFVDFVSSVHLQNLCNAANVRFHKMTRQQLHLELGEDNSFWVRDVLNGGRSRLLKTLSGGQKFQAALSLALALADNIHTLTESKHNFFFLDEGFGSLDRESLQVVFETLKSLRKENRIVGIISHVEDLQQEIDRYLTIHNDEELGSLISVN